VDTDYWFAFGPVPTVRRVIEQVRLIRDVDCSYPIILGADGRVMDGMHRIARAILEGRSTVKAVQFKIEPEPDYRNCSPGDLPYQ
jgi:elongation factor P hydroxylase